MQRERSSCFDDTDIDDVLDEIDGRAENQAWAGAVPEGGGRFLGLVGAALRRVLLMR